jgi:D-alanine-D-alanine ligase
MQKSILVLYGGNSNEREVSLRSGANVAKQLQANGHHVLLRDTAEPGFDLSQLVHEFDVVLPMLHGAGGEDGVLQREFDRLGVPYFGSDAEACVLTFNKVACKERLSENGIMTPPWEVVDQRQFESSPLRRRSYVLKPIAGGSTIDTLIVHNPEHQPVDEQAYAKLFKRYKKMLLEELIEGQEITVPVLGEQPLPVILIVPPLGEEFDYENKYNGRSQEIAQPHQLPMHLQSKAQKLALQVHRLTGCRHLSRTDIIIAEDGGMYVLETNTLPGMTEQSLVPKAAAVVGLDMSALVERFVILTET